MKNRTHQDRRFEGGNLIRTLEERSHPANTKGTQWAENMTNESSTNFEV